MSQSGDTGLMSSAGLVRYFESEDAHTPKLSPHAVVTTGVFLGLLLLVLNLIL